MKLQTTLPEKPLKFDFSYDSDIVLLGSCFVENIGTKLAYYNFRIHCNPFGIIFNPVSLEQLLERAVTDKSFSSSDLILDQGRYHCFEVHSKFSKVEATLVIEQLNTALNRFKNALQQASHLVVTLGTAWVYEYKKTGKIVANCHKVPQKEFEKKLLSPEEIEVSLDRLIAWAMQVNPELTFTFTVSPVRHLKDGFVENQRSKAHLITGLHKLIMKNSHVKCQYFPSYEMVMDELRDYRFYAEDMVHLNELGIKYVWERFKKAAFSEDAHATMKAVERIKRALAHRPFDVESQSYLDFRNRLNAQVENLKAAYPHMDFTV